MDFKVTRDAAAVVVAISQRLDAVTAPEFERKMRELIDGGDTSFVVDLGELDYISSAGLRGLLVTAKLLKTKAGQMRFANVQGNVKAVFDMSGFAAMFQVDDSVAVALAALA